MGVQELCLLMTGPALVIRAHVLKDVNWQRQIRRHISTGDRDLALNETCIMRFAMLPGANNC
jgi:hypothetical protein